MKYNFDKNVKVLPSLNLDFRMVKERFYAGVWYERGAYLPVDKSKDTKNEYCVVLSPTCTYFIDKLLLSEWTNTLHLSMCEYQNAVEHDWVNFNICTHKITETKDTKKVVSKHYVKDEHNNIQEIVDYSGSNRDDDYTYFSQYLLNPGNYYMLEESEEDFDNEFIKKTF